MASMGSFPFVIDTAMESNSAVQLQTWNYRRPKLPLFAFRPRKSVIECGEFSELALGCMTVEDVTVGCGGVGRTWRIKHLKATGGNGAGAGTPSDDADDSLQVAIKKSKKVLAMQRDLLEQIAERRKLVSTIKGTTLNTEVEELSPEEDSSFSNRDTTSIDEGYNPSISSSSSVLPVPNQLPDKPTAATDKQYGEDKKKRQNDLPPKSSLGVDFQKHLAGNTSGTTRSYELPPFVSEVSATSSPIYEKLEDSKKLSLQNADDVANAPISDNVKPPPLAGANVMNVILVAAECAPWSKTGSGTSLR